MLRDDLKKMGNMRLIAAFQEAGDKVGGEASTGLLLRPEVLHHVRQLLPVVEGFLYDKAQD